ncbi:MAG: ribosome biogenesis GTP-binding protein YihA/YsxC [Bacteroidia bacterium]|nr:ribosome biogenesis GTP-binding protein YihA/YsxC [Bacteroidia bacterium]MBT8269064.1 ribosome biogenesis GTP-binding protein YihA/YsxC [Bacteroidia bacterium]NNF81496.1 YihA family ribosome biogenesis GTP-binding protein [Flavobacteriaceae bacterium]NNK70600.1 YihA family ribosome biogenesis GTP-binding protein [Flavobacteriaceae bacterium]NNL81037.1 YihA family ribosome biogenesis GTP-binding protein [Flavobacteriaceae bacterium]
MRIKSAEFIVSNQDVSKCPDSKLPEYAFIGRSNVGKSSLINMLTQRKNLAKTSGRPGKTQLINHFLINNSWHLVDLPGYGYARVSKKERKTFQNFITAYFEKRRQLISAFVLIDIRHDPQSIDLEFMRWLGENQIPFSMVFTKADKLKPKAVIKHVNNYLDKLKEDWDPTPNYFITSALKKTGGEELLKYIESINEELKA